MIIYTPYFSFSSPDEDDLPEITTYLLRLDKNAMYHLGIELGLKQQQLKDMKETSDTFRDDVIAAWLRKEYKVSKKGQPTWRILADDLSTPRVRQNGIASEIEKNKGLNH